MTETKQSFLQTKINIDLNDKPKDEIERSLVEEGPYLAKFVDFKAVEIPKWKKPGETEAKIVATMLLTGVEKKIPFFLSPTILKAKKKEYSNSKLFDLLEKANLLPLLRENMTLEELVLFLEGNLLEKIVSVSVETV
mgnify:CR=1 FL=1